MLIGILQAGDLKRGDDAFREYDELYPAMLDGHGFDFRTWRVHDMDFPDSVDDADGWLIGGSRHGAYEDLPFIAPLENFIRAAFDKSIPLVGICFGHQILAQALGGTVRKNSGGWAAGRHEYDFNGEPYALNAWHQDQVVEAPAAAEVAATSTFCRYAALSYPGHAFTVQAHPEFGLDTLRPLLEKRAKGLVPDPVIDSALGEIDKPVDNARMADRIASFFKETANG